MALSSLLDLFKDELKDIYDAEKRLVKALPKMAKIASSENLSTAFTDHLAETETHVERLEQVLELLEMPQRGKPCEAMKGLLEEGKAMMSEDAEPAVMDAGLIMAAQKVEHYEIATYGSLVALAQELGLEDAAALLDETLNEEKAADEKLSEIANTVNSEANTEEVAA